MRAPSTAPIRNDPAPTPVCDLRTKLLYGVGSVAFGVKDGGFATFLLIYYSQVLGLAAERVGFAIMLALVVDAVVDPAIGWLSDRLHSPWGRRHPFMYAAALPVGVAYYFLWSPPAGLSPDALFAYLLGVAIVVRLFIACFEIPNSSLAPELTDHYDERTTLMSFRYFFGWWGALAMAIAAYTIFLQPDATHPTGVLNPVGYRHYGLAGGAVMALAIVVSSLGTHRHIPHLKSPPPRRRLGLAGTLRELRETLSNRSFRILFGAGIFNNVGSGLAGALTLYFNTYFWELSSTQMSLLALSNFLSAALALAVAPAFSRRVGKKAAAITTELAVIALAPLAYVLRLLGAFPANGSPALVPLLAVFNVVVIALFITSTILIASMLSDVVEESELTTGRRSEGVFFAASAFVQKAASGAGIFVSTLLLRAIAFPAAAHPGAVDPAVIFRLGAVYPPVLGVLFLVAVALLSAFGISRAAHEANLRRLGRAS